MPAAAPRLTAPSPAFSWSEVSQQFERHIGHVLLAAAAVALLMIVSFIGLLQGQVQRGELLRAQQRLAVSTPKAAPVIVVARRGR